MSTPSLLLVSLLAILGTVDAFFILNHAPLVRERLDPIVSPGSISSHVHNVVGGSRFGPSYDYDDLRQSRCTTAAVNVDATNYWTPLLYYYKPEDGSYQAIGSYARTYYLQRPGSRNEKINAFPKGLRMVAGDPFRRTYDASSFADQAVSFVCLDYYNSHQGDPEWEQRPDFFKHQCPDGMRAQVFFPSCWDGVNLDSPDHKSHMAYPIDNYQGGNCPSSHPVHLASLFYEFIYSTGDFPFNADGVPTWVFANGDTTGLGMHGDFVNGWDVDVLQAALDTCGDETGGDINACDAFKPYIDYAAADACRIETDVVNEDIGWGHSIPQLPGNNPLWSTNTTKPSDPSYTESAGYTSSGSTLPENWEEVGCILEPSGGRALLAAGFNSGEMTRATCVDYCASLSLPLASVEYGSECRCDSQLRNGATQDTVSTSQCGMECSGLTTENCGGRNKFTLFVNPAYASTEPILPSGWVYSSCMTEATSGRALGDASFASDAMTVESCVGFCADRGFAYAGVEYGRECFCSDTVAASSAIADESTCSMSCAGDLRQTCGGPSRLSVYYDSNRMISEPAASSASPSSSASASLISSVVLASSSPVPPTSSSEAVSTPTSTSILSTSSPAPIPSSSTTSTSSSTTPSPSSSSSSSPSSLLVEARASPTTCVKLLGKSLKCKRDY